MSLSSIIEMKDLKGDDSAFVSFESQLDNADEVAGPSVEEVAQSQLQKTKDETAALIASAKAEVEQIKKDAYDTGFAQGEEEDRCDQPPTIGVGQILRQRMDVDAAEQKQDQAQADGDLEQGFQVAFHHSGIVPHSDGKGETHLVSYCPNRRKVLG